MAITGPASYLPTIAEFLGHWELANTSLSPQSLTVRLASDNTTLTRTQFDLLRASLQTQQNTVQSCLTAQQVVRGGITLKKTALLAQFHLFTSLLDGSYRNTEFYPARPVAPSLGDGQEVFSRPMGEMMALWEQINGGPAPAGVSLPLVLGDGTSQGAFASALSALQFAYAEDRRKGVIVTVARGKRNLIQDRAYEVMKTYREKAPNALTAFPELVDSVPRLSPLPGHTPAPVNASALFEAPNASKVVHDASTDPMLESYQLRGNVGDHYDEEDAVVIATHSPSEPREFVTGFGLTQPGAQVALKVFVILNTGNEAGSASMVVERPANVQELAA